MAALCARKNDYMHYDAIIIGSGQAGVPLASRLAKAGLTTAIIEKSHFGGTCVNTGCTPTKAYVASARRAYAARTADELGIEIGGHIRANLQKIKQRKDELVQSSREGIASSLEKNDQITVYRGHARFIGNKRVQVGDSTLTAEKIFINVGARPRIPEGFAGVDYLTNESMLELTDLPEHLIVVGGSYIGLEFAQMFRRFGSRVTIIEMSDRLINREDEDISAAILDIVRQSGIEVRLNAECLSGRQEGDRIIVEIECSEGEPTATGSHLLLATGRTPNTDELGLDAAGIATDDHGYIRVNDRLETGVDGIWALGDCNGEGAFTHTSYNDYQIVAANLLDGDSRSLQDRIMCYALYIDPPLGRVGQTEQEARQSGRQVRVARFAMDKVARAQEKGETQGFMKVLIEAASEQVIGAAILGIEGDEIIHSLLDLMYAGASYTVIRDAMHIHPTVSELIPTMLQDLQPLDEEE